MRRVVPLLLAACTPAEPTASWVEPIDGYTGWPSDAPLVVVSPEIEAPPDYEVRERIRVVDLADGGFVAGTTASEGAGLAFLPDAPWMAGRRYAWTVDDTAPVPHGPEWTVPEGLSGTAVFDTDPSLEVLAAGLHDEGRACLVLSARAPEPAFVVGMTIDDVPAGPTGEAELMVLPLDAWATDLVDAGLEPAVDVACLAPQIAVDVGARIRVWFGDDGPWFAEVSEESPADLVAARHRFVPAEEEPAEGDTSDEEAP